MVARAEMSWWLWRMTKLWKADWDSGKGGIGTCPTFEWRVDRLDDKRTQAFFARHWSIVSKGSLHNRQSAEARRPQTGGVELGWTFQRVANPSSPFPFFTCEFPFIPLASNPFPTLSIDIT